MKDNYLASIYNDGEFNDMTGDEDAFSSEINITNSRSRTVLDQFNPSLFRREDDLLNVFRSSYQYNQIDYGFSNLSSLYNKSIENFNGYSLACFDKPKIMNCSIAQASINLKNDSSSDSINNEKQNHHQLDVFNSKYYLETSNLEEIKESKFETKTLEGRAISTENSTAGRDILSLSPVTHLSSGSKENSEASEVRQENQRNKN